MTRKSKVPKCVECGKRLTRDLWSNAETLSHSPPSTTLDSLTTDQRWTGNYGHGGNNYFCSHRCGFQWAVDAAHHVLEMKERS